MNILKNTYLLPVNGKYLIHSPLSKTTALINKSAANEIKGMFAGSSDPIESSPMNNLFSHLSQLKVLPEKRKGTVNPLFLGIIPTRSCNGACIYCDFGALGASQRNMSLAMAVSAVDWFTEIVRKKKREYLEIHFFGGEPMMEMEVIETVVLRARNNAAKANLKPVFEISTNGQYSKENARFLGDYFTSVILSLDGNEDIQNFHRPLKNGVKSFRNAVSTAEIISNSNAKLGLRACVSNKNVHLMPEIASWFCNEFNPSTINFEALRETAETSAKGLFPPDPYEFARKFTEARTVCLLKGIPLVYATDITDNPTYSSCPVGKDTAIVSPDGRVSNCYLLPEQWREVGLDLDFGQINEDHEVVINMESLKNTRKLLLNKPRCSKCFCRWSCAGGCHVSCTFPGSVNRYDDSCIQTRIISLCSLLSKLGLEADIQKFLNDKAGLEQFVFQSSDQLTDLNN